MEVEVRVVAGVENCYASLPISLLQLLESTHPGHRLPHFLPLQLRSLSSSPSSLWHVAWSGSASSSSAIEIAQAFAECIGLPDRTIVEVRALSNVSKASLLTIEPLTEDDWEVIELNAESAEAAILSQVRLVHGKMRFPLWLHGHRIVTFTVASMVPDKTVVQLVPGTEIAVAPKRRRKPADECKDSSLKSLNEDCPLQKAILRVQDPKKRLIQESHLRGYDVGIELTSVVLIHPDTARKFLFECLQVVVIVPRLPSKVKLESSGNNMLRKKELNGEHWTNGKDSRYTIARLLFSESVAKGHVMLCQSLRLYLRVSIHSWIYMQRYRGDLKKDVPLVSLSPCQFVVPRSGKGSQTTTTEALDDGFNLEGPHSTSEPVHDMRTLEELFSALSDGLVDTAGREVGFPSNTKGKLKALLLAWITAQFRAINSMAEVEPTSLVLGPTTFFCFKWTSKNCGFDRERWASQTDSSGDTRIMSESGNEILYVLNTTGDSLLGQKYSVYELSVAGDEMTSVHDDLRIFLENMSLGGFMTYDTSREHVFSLIPASTFSSLGWMGTATSEVINRLRLLLSPACGAWFGDLKLPLPGHILIYGPPGSGKTLLASAAAKSLEENRDILAHTVFISCSELAIEKVTSIREMLCDYISDALDNAPSIIVFDDLDSIITSSTDSEGSQMSTSAVMLTEFITGIMDEYGEKRMKSCGLGPIAFVACVRAFDSIPQTLTASGRLDFHIQLPAPSTSERMAILRHEIQKRSLQCSDDVLLDVASKCDGYDAYDLAILVDRSIHAAISRFLPSHVVSEGEKPSLIADDFLQARQDFLPVSMRDITKSASEGGRLGWEDVGGLSDVRNAIKEVRDVFAKAAAAAPCLLFFDEFDSIAPKRGHDNTGVTDRVVNQFLTELDGVEVLTGVFVFAATSRPDLLDAALLRPGRLDRLLFCDFPALRDRVDILRVLSRKLPLADDVDLDTTARMTDGFSGADLQALLSDAQLAAVQELLDSGYDGKSGKSPVITGELLKSVASKAKPSVSESEKQRLYAIYNQFLDSKRSAGAQARDAKGKRATLA